MRRIIFTIGLAAGYVLGSRAGRSRYEQIARAAQRLRTSQRVQSVAGVVAESVSSAGSSVRHKMRHSDDAAVVRAHFQSDHAG